MGDIRLVDLDLFKRYSLAIRQETAPAEEVLAILEATRRQIVATGLVDEWAADADPSPAVAVAADVGVPGDETAGGEDWEPAPDIDRWVREEEEAAARKDEEAAGADEAWASAGWSTYNPEDEDAAQAEDRDEQEDVAAGAGDAGASERGYQPASAPDELATPPTRRRRAQTRARGPLPADRPRRTDPEPAEPPARHDRVPPGARRRRR